jgi:hypothetical protein
VVHFGGQSSEKRKYEKKKNIDRIASRSAKENQKDGGSRIRITHDAGASSASQVRLCDSKGIVANR